MLKRIKNIWALSKKDLKVIESLTKEDLAYIPETGDGKTVFFGEGTTEEYEDLQRKDKFGIKKLFGL